MDTVSEGGEGNGESQERTESMRDRPQAGDQQELLKNGEKNRTKCCCSVTGLFINPLAWNVPGSGALSWCLKFGRPWERCREIESPQERPRKIWNC